MAHIIFGAYGIKHDLDQFIKYMETRTFPMEVIDKDGKKVTTYVQGALRPLLLFDYVHPRECTDMVLNSLQLRDAVALTDGKGTRVFKNYFKIIQKLLKLKRIPKSDKNKGQFPLYKNNLRLVGIGYKDDIDFKNSGGVTQEAL